MTECNNVNIDIESNYVNNTLFSLIWQQNIADAHKLIMR